MAEGIPYFRLRLEMLLISTGAARLKRRHAKPVIQTRMDTDNRGHGWTRTEKGLDVAPLTPWLTRWNLYPILHGIRVHPCIS
jgi:DMSO/TMAO reductase YedYZ molybdopterin-dependent catalytic subunit